MGVRRTMVTLVGTLALAGCSQGGNESTVTITGTAPASPLSSPTATAEPTATPPTDAPQVDDTIATGLAVPWGLDFFANGDAIVTERDTRRVLRISGAKHVVEEIGRIDIAVPQGEGGVLGVALSPSFKKDRLVYFYVSTATDNRVVRTTLDKGGLGDLDVVLRGIPNGFIHDGGRLEFGPDGYLYVSTGEGGKSSRARDRESLGGKILRITPDGKPAPGNPFGTAVWSWGHRNIQGLAFVGRRLWASEFGQDTFDELNLIEAGKNYGWPDVEGKGGTDQGYVDPQLTWGTDVASPSGLAYGDGHLWLAALRGERLWRINVDGDTASNPTAFFIGDYGRMRTVAFAPDGMLWLMTSNQEDRGTPGADDDQILLIEP